MRVVDRLLKYLENKNISPYNFEKSCDIANGYLGKQSKGKGTIGSSIVEKIKARYKDLNVTWLLTGEGQMLTAHYYVETENVSTLSESEVVYHTHQTTITGLKEKIAILESALADKEKIIRLLENQLAQK
jgi:hypothetical protein